MKFPALFSDIILSMRLDAIIAADREGIIRFWNLGAERIFGHSVDDAVGYSLDPAIPQRLRKRHWDGYWQTMKPARAATARAMYSRFLLLAKIPRRSQWSWRAFHGNLPRDR